MRELLEKILVVEEGWGTKAAQIAATGIIGGAAMLGGARKAISNRPPEKPAVVVPVEVSKVEPEAEKVSVDMKKIVSIESSNNPKAENERSGARGLTQIMKSTWEEIVQKMGEDWSWDEAFDREKNLAVGTYYMNVEIPRLLKHYGIADTIENRLAAYDWGVGNLQKNEWNDAPQETVNYIKKYRD